MDFLHRNPNNQPRESRDDSAGTGAGAFSHADGRRSLLEPNWLRIVFVVLLFSLTILAIALTTLMYFGKVRQANYVDKDSYQAVFLTNGQVYFGQMKGVNDQYVNLQDIYYLNSQSQDAATDKDKTAATSFSLVKLGCELHGPMDQMIVNREQVSFWENLTAGGKVSKAITQWKAENPNGQKCTTNTNSTQQSPAGTTPTDTTP